jgi:2'-phosphotransferase
MARSKPEAGRGIAISKALSLLLRHAAEKEGVKINAEGYANVADVV